MARRKHGGFAVAVLALAAGCDSGSSGGEGGAPGTAGVAGSTGIAGAAGSAGSGIDDITLDPPVGNAKNAELPRVRCPGSVGCPRTDDPTLYVGAAAVDITPDVDYVVAHATGNRRSYEPDVGDKCVAVGSCDLSDVASCEAVDENLCTWIGGTSSGRGATGVAGEISLRCAVLRQGETTTALCSMDTVLWLYEEVERTRTLLEEQHPELDIDLLLVTATHNHQSQDTVGFFGPATGRSGLDRDYNARVRQRTVDAVAQAAADLVPAHAQFGAIRVDGSLPGTDLGGHQAAAFVSDTRDPVVIDDELRVLRFNAVDTGQTITTLINWTSHPEFAGLGNTLVHPDYPGALRTAVEDGIDVRDSSGEVMYQADGIGGLAIFYPGALGGQVGPGLVKHVGLDGVERTDSSPERADEHGRLLAAYALAALEDGSETVEAPSLGLRAQEIYVTAENRQLLLGNQLGLFDVSGYHYDPSQPQVPGNFPLIKSQVAVVDIGPAQIVTIPGEPHTELLLATRDGVTSVEAPFPFTPAPFHIINHPDSNPGCRTDGYSRCHDPAVPIAEMDTSRVVDLSRDGSERYRWVFALTQGHNGYIVPEYDFLLSDTLPYFREPDEGRHYEETLAFGPEVETEVIDPLRQLLQQPAVVER